MTKFNTIHVLGILMISLIAFAPVVDAGCSCSGGTWDPSYFLNSEPGTSQAVQSSNAQNNAAGNSGNSTENSLDRMASYPNGEILKPMKSVSSSDVVLDVSNGNSYSASH